MIDLNYLIGVVILIIWGSILLKLSQSRNKKGRKHFFLVMIIPLFIFFASFLLKGDLLVYITTPLGLVMSVLIGTFIYFWSLALYEAGGERKTGWFWMILFIPILFIVYKIGEY